MRFRVALVAFFLYLPIPHVIAADNPLTLDVIPKRAFAPSDMRITTRVTPDARNRALCLEVDGEMYRSSCWELDGDKAPVTTETWYRSIKAGWYEIRVSLERTGGEVVFRNQTVCILPSGMDPGTGCEVGWNGQDSGQDCVFG
jgi:hypothetical protein